MKNKNLLIYSCVFHILLQMLDGVLTYIGISLYGSQVEANPIMRGLINNLGLIPGLLVSKGLCCYLILEYINYILPADKINKLSWILVNIMNLIYLTVVLIWIFLLSRPI